MISANDGASLIDDTFLVSAFFAQPDQLVVVLAESPENETNQITSIMFY
jgi:hypothetical protein